MEHARHVFRALLVLVVAVIFLIFLAGARLTIPNRTVLPYAFPLPALGLIISTLFGVETGLVFSFAAALLARTRLRRCDMRQ